jgi:hypothetical protein
LHFAFPPTGLVKQCVFRPDNERHTKDSYKGLDFGRAESFSIIVGLKETGAGFRAVVRFWVAYFGDATAITKPSAALKLMIAALAILNQVRFNS